MFTICYLILTVAIITAIPASKIIIKDFIAEVKEVFGK